MQIEVSTVVSISYELREKDANGEVIETVSDSNPFVFLYGAGFIIEGLETGLKGLEPGQTFALTVPCEKAYGRLNDKFIFDIPRQVFTEAEEGESLLKIGNRLMMQDQHGEVIEGIVLKIGDEFVTMDFNHPLAGKDLYFSGKVLEVREATPSELEHGHVHKGPEEHSH